MVGRTAGHEEAPQTKVLRCLGGRRSAAPDSRAVHHGIDQHIDGHGAGQTYEPPEVIGVRVRDQHQIEAPHAETSELPGDARVLRARVDERRVPAGGPHQRGAAFADVEHPHLDSGRPPRARPSRRRSHAPRTRRRRRRKAPARAPSTSSAGPILRTDPSRRIARRPSHRRPAERSANPRARPPRQQPRRHALERAPDPGEELGHAHRPRQRHRRHTVQDGTDPRRHPSRRACWRSPAR